MDDGRRDVEGRTALARVAAASALAAVGRSADDLVVVREGTSVLVGAPAARVMVRVDDRVGPSRVARHVAVAEVLELADAPTVRLLPGVAQPLTDPDSGWPVTLWRLEAVQSGVVSPRELGALARRLHVTTSRLLHDGVEGAVPDADPLGALRSLVSSPADGPPTAAGEQPGGHRSDGGPATAQAAEDVAVVLAEAERLEPVWAAAAAGASQVIHADLHRDNVLLTERGPVLADLELAGRGPAAYDVAPQVVAVSRYGAPAGDLDEFLAGFGSAPDEAVLAPMVAVYELWVTAWALANRHLDDAHEREARLRMRRWRAEPSADPAPWTLR